ncbi:MAG TPA: outer membrane lipoprotein carrier protein LolA [Gammaproteobacteria bacterium]|nr:outer membrane lipoprotein carrier protein LolA [Gammaproteobacteria bacterium]
MRPHIVLPLLFLCLAPLATADTVPASFAADFVQTRSVPGFETPIVSHGNMSYDKAKGFHWEVTRPYHYLFEMNGKQAHEQLPDGTRRSLDPDQTPWLAAVEHIFISALSGDRSQLQAYFDVTQKPASQGEEVTLMPKSGPIAQAIGKIEVEESAPGRPQHLQIFETSGGHMDIRFTPLTSPKP